MEYVSNGGCARPRGASVRIVGVREASAKGGPSQFLDVSKGLVSAADAAAIDQKARQAQAKIGAKAFVVAVRADEDVESYRPLYKELGMDGRDLLVVFNDAQRHLHTQALSKKIGNEILAATKTLFYSESRTAGVMQMLDEVVIRLNSKVP